jgi:hypothetical protein
MMLTDDHKSIGSKSSMIPGASRKHLGVGMRKTGRYTKFTPQNLLENTALYCNNDDELHRVLT